jgi:mRNA-degrading endonuclease YafQ of YafQ-DinJ toxin-antitoxin module
MSIDATLIVKKNDQKRLTVLLSQCPALSDLVPLPHLYQSHKLDENRFDIWSIAIKKDIYGQTNQISPQDVEFLKRFKKIKIFVPTVFSNKNSVGDFNLDLIRFIKHCAVAAGTMLRVCYEESGADDRCHKQVTWFFDYSVDSTVVEQLHIIDYVRDYRCVPDKSAQITKLKNGQVIFEGFKSKPYA